MHSVHLHLTLLRVPDSVSSGSHILTIKAFIPVLMKNEGQRNFKYVAISSPWELRSSVQHDYKIVRDIYDKNLFSLTQYLNKINKTTYSFTFWKIFLGPWLLQIIMGAFIKEKITREAFENYKIISVSSLADENKYLVYDSDETYTQIHRFDEFWNFSQYSIILRRFEKRYSDLIYFDIDEGGEKSELKALYKKSKLEKLNDYINSLVYRFRLNSSVFYGSHFNKMDLIKLQLKLGFFPSLLTKSEYVASNKKSNRSNLEDIDIIGSANSILNESISKIIKQLIPVYAFEDLNLLRRYVSNSKGFPDSPKLIFTSTALWFDTFFKAYVAFTCEDNEHTVLLQMQHCGSAAVTKCNLMDYEEEFADYYLTWGHNTSHSTRQVSFGIPKQTHSIKRKTESNNGDLLIIRSWNPHHAQKLSIEIDTDEVYFDDTLSLVKGLTSSIATNDLLIRLYPAQTAFGSGFKCIKNEAEFWATNFPNISTDSTADITKLYGSARIVVYTYLQGTGYIECLANNIPLIIMVRDCDDIFHDDFLYFADKLRGLNVLFDCPLKASKHLNKIFDNVDSWWLQDDLQKTICEFNDIYIQKSENRISSFKEIINRIYKQ
jgi:putative transferase (TIGR04331 family)